MWAGYIVYNAASTLEMSLKSILPFVDKVVIVDGVCLGFPHITVSSYDDTKDIAENICGEKLLWIPSKDKPYADEAAKRNVYLNMVPNGKWVLTLDADETIAGEMQREFAVVERSRYKSCYVRLDNFNPKWRGKGINIPRETYSTLEWVKNIGVGARLFRKNVGDHYVRDHAVYGYTGMLLTRKEYLLKDVTISNLKYLKTYDEYISGCKWRESALKRGIVKPQVKVA